MEKLNDEQQKALQEIAKGNNIFLTGAGGVGKGVTLGHAIEMFKKQGKNYSVTASTGIAALTIGGSTLHSMAKIGLATDSVDVLVTKTRFNKKQKNMWLTLEVLIIDEISMLDVDYFETLDKVVRNIRGRDEPFGGIQMILVGDFLQLPAVKAKRYLFETELWHDMNLTIILLKQVMRQTDETFIRVLSKVRIGDIDDEVIKTLSARGKKHDIEGILKLHCKKIDVDKYNEQEMAKLDTPEKIYNATMWSEGCDNKSLEKTHFENFVKNVLARSKTILKVGCKVIHVINDNDKNLKNGSQGVVVDFVNGYPVVQFIDGRKFTIMPHTWETKTKLDGIFKYKQIPLLVAYALTVHKSQSVSLDLYEVNLGEDVFEVNMTYTALSRARTLEGLYISSLKKKSLLLVDKKCVDLYKMIEA